MHMSFNGEECHVITSYWLSSFEESELCQSYVSDRPTDPSPHQQNDNNPAQHATTATTTCTLQTCYVHCTLSTENKPAPQDVTTVTSSHYAYANGHACKSLSPVCAASLFSPNS